MVKQPLVMIVLAAALTSASAVGAERRIGSRGCDTDVQQFCKDVASRRAALRSCLKRHREELSPTCRAKFERARQAMPKEVQPPPEVKAPIYPCSADVLRLCSGVPTTPGTRKKCLEEHLSQLSPGCAALIRRQQAPPQKPCAPDIERFCKKDSSTPASVPACLAAHQAELAPACKALMRKPPAVPALPCMEDASRFCKGVMPGEGRVVNCLRKHDTELTEPCRRSLTLIPVAPPSKYAAPPEPKAAR